jgi:hypothetical protein
MKGRIYLASENCSAANDISGDTGAGGGTLDQDYRNQESVFNRDSGHNKVNEYKTNSLAPHFGHKTRKVG